ncbi:MAG: HEPN domain-containing protein [Patescibacteria group bacterium]
MQLSSQKISKQISYWRLSASRNWDTALYLFKGRRYSDSLFFAHLTIEKLLKGLVVLKTKELPPRIHDLARLAALADLALNQKQTRDFREITDFNIAGRYEDEKYAFYKRCTESYANKWLKICRSYNLWLKRQYQKK